MATAAMAVNTRVYSHQIVIVTERQEEKEERSLFMKVKTLVLASAGSLLLAGAANAELAGVSFVVVQDTETDFTVQAIANFTDTADILQAVAGLPGTPLVWETTASSGLVNDDDGDPDGGNEDDIPFALNGEFDSWLAMGATGIFSANFQFTPDFWGVPNGENITVLTDGLQSISNDDSAYFFGGPGNAVGDLEGALGEEGTGDVIIGQFSVGKDFEVRSISFSGLIQWATAGAGATQTPFSASIDVPAIPAPGALALLGLAGLAGTRRRRR